MTHSILKFLFCLILLFASTQKLQAQEDFEAVATFQPLLNAWNDAINAADIKKLEAMYANDLYIYGSNISKTACLESKKKFFVANPGYRQHVGEIYEVRMPFEGRYQVIFNKEYTQKGIAKSVNSYLTFDALENGKYILVAESDEISDKNAAKNAKEVFITNGKYCFEDKGTVFNSVAIPAPYALNYEIEVLNGQVNGDGGYYSSAMRSYYTLSITGISKSDGTLLLRIRAEGPMFPDEPKDFMVWQQHWKYTGHSLRWIGGNPSSSTELNDIGCDE